MTKNALFYRTTASVMLRGKWLVAALSALIVSLFSCSKLGSLTDFFESGSISGLPKIVAIIAVIWYIAAFLLGGAINLGYAFFKLKLIDGNEVSVKDVFSQLHRIGDGFLLQLLQGIYILLWSLLLIVPGIIKGFAYAMAPYILMEHPDLGASDAITRSKELMDGNKARLFWLRLSFVGWGLLTLVPALAADLISIPLLSTVLSIISLVAVLFVGVYIDVAEAAFYRDISTPAA